MKAKVEHMYSQDPCKFPVYILSFVYFLYDGNLYNHMIISQVGQGRNSQLDIVIADNRKLGHELKLSHRIPQLDGPIPDQYDEAVSTPNVSFCLFLRTSLAHVSVNITAITT